MISAAFYNLCGWCFANKIHGSFGMRSFWCSIECSSTSPGEKLPQVQQPTIRCRKIQQPAPSKGSQLNFKEWIGIVNWHPLGTIWIHLEGPRRYLLSWLMPDATVPTHHWSSLIHGRNWNCSSWICCEFSPQIISLTKQCYLSLGAGGWCMDEVYSLFIYCTYIILSY